MADGVVPAERLLRHVGNPMTAQLNLFAEPRARHDAPVTSVIAAAVVKPRDARRMAEIAAIVDAHPEGLTADEVFDRLERGPARSTVHGAVSRAAKLGLIVPVGHAPSATGCPMRVFVTPRYVEER